MWFIRDSIVSKVTDLSLAFVDMPLDTVEKAPNIFLWGMRRSFIVENQIRFVDVVGFLPRTSDGTAPIFTSRAIHIIDGSERLIAVYRIR